MTRMDTNTRIVNSRVCHPEESTSGARAQFVKIRAHSWSKRNTAMQETKYIYGNL